jgi:hypothetical protein
MTSTTYTYTSPVIGTSGQVLMSNGTSIPINNNATNSITWGTTTTAAPWITTTVADPNLKGASIQVKGDAEFEGDVKIKGKSLTKLIDNIEKRLAILHPNERLEEKWEKLKILGEQYREMEKELLHAEEMWKILKK